jgi:hypothetical protein
MKLESKLLGNAGKWLAGSPVAGKKRGWMERVGNARLATPTPY